MDKDTNKELMELAERILQEWEQCPLFKDRSSKTIYESYNGQISALGVSILMIGLKPTIAVYYQDEPKQGEAHRRCLLEVIARMLGYDDLESLVRNILASTTEEMKTEIINCSVALKQVIRTYKLG
ncbi:hypothetical protein H8784_14510 [Parabacteroides acidifaciens]|uniref:CRISPR type III-B/RAMP module-associated protein Cmr5 n=1 Tax=Parabacteroides acidifaciens TaxID=2290935 RepID=A0A3D8HBU6_9BACT|nr:type III-B CRISPR module-associated protein Cmr5 [Parabacteroides acidifaciens]MBC8602926.1 hypothetical protein [Parabacteroides acidifaciens]RDU48331.1 hypothetical protein DWU89_14885 [Parabacteroides acidifaciens]